MMSCARPPAPEILAQNAPSWTARWLERRAADPGAGFRWPTVEGRPANQHILAALNEMTAGHCAYCDGWPLEDTTDPSIDHFRPKAHFPEAAFGWSNLFLACGRCQGPQGKSDRWDDDLLKPDAEDYSFERYFRYVAATGELEPNPQASAKDQRRAEITISLLGLNAGSRPQSRRRIQRLYTQEASRPYRFVFG